MLFLGLCRVFTQKIIEFQMVEIVVTLPIMLDQTTEALKCISCHFIIGSNQRSQRTPAQWLLGHQQYTEDRLEHRAPLRAVTLETVN